MPCAHVSTRADVARSRGKAPEEVRAMLDEGIFDMQRYKEGGWVTGERGPGGAAHGWAGRGALAAGQEGAHGALLRGRGGAPC